MHLYLGAVANACQDSRRKDHINVVLSLDFLYNFYFEHATTLVICRTVYFFLNDLRNHNMFVYAYAYNVWIILCENCILNYIAMSIYL